MILSASRRTDLPAFYSDWFLRRMEEGMAMVRSPRHPHLLHQLSLAKGAVDGVVFWSKNPAPLLPALPLSQGIDCSLQFTLTPYGSPLEPGIPELSRRLDTFRQASDILGAERVIWRYDPIFLTKRWTVAEHLNVFEELSRALAGYTYQCVISFLDFYPGISQRMKAAELLPLSAETCRRLAKSFQQIAAAYGIQCRACCESSGLLPSGFPSSRCVDPELFPNAGLFHQRDRGQRPGCGCAPSADLGAYGTCLHGCLYCYATHNFPTLEHWQRNHDPASPLLWGRPGPDDQIIPWEDRYPGQNQLRLEGW